jgi:Na+/proline symporter
MGVLATLYTVLGGLSAVLWTDLVQFVILIGGAVWIAVALVLQVPGGVGGILDVARATGHLELNWNFSLVEMTAIGVAIGFFFQMMQDYGTDQVTVQRLLATRDFRGTVKAVFFNACVDFFLIALLLFIGIGLFAFYQGHPTPATSELRPDQILPFFMVSHLPNGVSGLLIAGIFAAAMSSMDSGMNSMATVVVTDFVQPLRRKRSGTHDVTLARMITVVLGVLATGMAFYISTRHGIIETFAEFMSLFNAPVLALFLMGMLTRGGRFGGWCAGTGVALPATYYVQHCTDLNWVYYFPFSLAVALGIGLPVSALLNRIAGRPPVDAALTVWGRARPTMTDIP